MDLHAAVSNDTEIPPGMWDSVSPATTLDESNVTTRMLTFTQPADLAQTLVSLAFSPARHRHARPSTSAPPHPPPPRQHASVLRFRKFVPQTSCEGDHAACDLWRLGVFAKRNSPRIRPRGSVNPHQIDAFSSPSSDSLMWMHLSGHPLRNIWADSRF